MTADIIYTNTKKWNGDHLVDPVFVPGVLFTNDKIKIDSASVLDIAPTIIDALGIKKDPDMDGRSLLQ
jgi:bisphosphoglycerate-independent phosphoglycerate mutase (AlkP superfamily)